MNRAEIAQAMSLMAAQFSAGEIDTVAFVAVMPDGSIESGYYAVGIGENARLVGALRFVEADIIEAFGGTERQPGAMS